MVLTATLASGPALGQFDPRPLGYPGMGRTTPAVGFSGLATDEKTTPGGVATRYAPAAGAPELGALPSVLPAASPLSTRKNPIERVSMNSVPGSDPSEPLPPGVSPLPMASVMPGGSSLPAGSYPGPWTSDRAGCCGPVGGNGAVTYELFAVTGINFVSGSDLTDRLLPGITAGGGGRSFLFNPEGTAAWTIDLGLTYTYNRGIQDDTLFALDKGSISIDPIFGTQTTIPPSLQRYRLRALHRTSFNYGFGRDCWLWGPGTPGYESGWNIRWGALLGGRWGTAHADLVPFGEDTGYYRSQATFLGVYFDAHVNWEVPLGGSILFGGLALQYGRDWMNILPPLDSDLDNVNLMLTAGLRF